jgi:hypothetical protein
MKIPVAFDPNNLNSGKGVRRGTISVVTNNTPDQNLEVTWYTSLDSGDNLILTNDSLTLDKQPDPGLATPLFWPTARDSASFLETINGLPRSPKNITDMGTAWEYLASNNYFILDPNNPLPNIVTDGLVLDIEANQPTSYPTTGSTIYDLSGVENNGTLVNGPTFNTNGWFDFDGINEVITYGNGNTFFPLPSFSIELTFQSKGTVPTTGTSPGLFGFTYGIRLSAGTSVMTYSISSGSIAGGYSLNTNDNVNYRDGGRWYTVVCQTDATSSRIYVNGQFKNSRSLIWSGSTVWPTNGWNLGRDNNNSNQFFTGSISNLKIYNKILSQAEINQNYYGGPIVTDGLVLAVDAGNLVSYESGSTTTYPLTGSVNGTLINGVKYNSNNGGHWEFDGVDDYITWGDNFDLVSSNISGFVWGKVNTLDDYTPWIDKLSGGGNYRFHSDVVGRLVLGIRDSNNAYQQTITTSVLSIDTWYNIGFTFNNSTREGKIYLNGRLIHSNTFTIDRGDTTTPLQTGYQSNNGGTLNGALATLSLYNKALTASEVAQNFNAQKSRFGL